VALADFSVGANDVIEIPSQTSMHLSCCPLYQIGSIEDICGKPQVFALRQE
jgi:hypothetical protein